MDKLIKNIFLNYRLYVESMEKISDRRQNANNYFVAINTVLISFIGILFQIKLFESMDWIKSLIALLIALVGLIVCWVFWFLLRSYRQLNTGKFKVIHEIEQRLPASIYDYEWQILGEGKK